jgi:hypothetical protein
MGLVLVIAACRLQILVALYQPHKDKYTLLDHVLVIVLKEVLHVRLLVFLLMALIVMLVVDGLLRVVLKEQLQLVQQVHVDHVAITNRRLVLVLKGNYYGNGFKHPHLHAHLVAHVLLRQQHLV